MTERHATIPDAQNGFTHLHLTVHRCLTSDEIARVSGCLVPPSRKCWAGTP